MRSDESIKINVKGLKLTDYQKAFLYSQKRFTTVQASTKTGKTVSHNYWLFKCAHANTEKKAKELNPYLSPAKEGYNYWWAAPVYSQAQIAFNRLRRKISKYGIYQINKSDLSITTPIGTIIQYKTAKDPDNLYGEDVYAAVMDEYTRMKQESWFALRSTLTATNAPCKFIGNYKGKSNWGHQLSLKALQPNSNYENFKVTAYDAVKAGILSLEEVEQARQDLPKDVFSALYLAEGEFDESRLIDDESIQDMLSNSFIEKGTRYITADIAFEGSDKFVIAVWEGFRVISFKAFDKSPADDVERIIKSHAEQYNVKRSNIAYDADGVGGFLKGYLKGAYEFNNNGAPIKEGINKPSYTNLKSQCYFALARKINGDGMYFDCNIDKYWSDIIDDLESVRNRSHGKDGKLEVLRKSEVKELIGRSPDYSDCLMMRMVFDLKPKTIQITKSKLL